MDSPQVKCRRCLLRDMYPEDYKKFVSDVLDKMPRAAKTDDAAYRARLDVCVSCNQLSNGTCMGCGCLVEIRAAQKKLRCPFGKWTV